MFLKSEFSQQTDLCKLESLSNITNKYGLVQKSIRAKEHKAMGLIENLKSILVATHEFSQTSFNPRHL